MRATPAPWSSGDFCFLAGTTGYDYASMSMPDGVVAQARNALATIEAALGEAGFALGDVVRARYVVTDRAFVDAVYGVLGDTFGEIRPAATMDRVGSRGRGDEGRDRRDRTPPVALGGFPRAHELRTDGSGEETFGSR